MSPVILRDRDAIVTKEGIVFRVFGYSHLPSAYLCDVEYASAEVYQSENPKALRNHPQRLQVFYKFYEDEGLRFVQSRYPKYYIHHEILQKKVIAVNHSDILVARRPKDRLRELLEARSEDKLVGALQEVVKTLIAQGSNLSANSFGVFGSLFHAFHHPDFSDLDFVIYGSESEAKLRETLQEMYRSERSPLRNEFENEEVIKGKRWRFKNFSPKEYLWHQRRKLIYAVYSGEKGERRIKTEFEPVKDWEEINVDHTSEVRVMQRGWVKMVARVEEDSDGPFIPSIYEIQPLEVLHGAEGAIEACRIVSFMEEFRMQAFRDEKVYVEGNLEEVMTSENRFYQVTLTYCPRYYEQVMKVTE